MFKPTLTANDRAQAGTKSLHNICCVGANSQQIAALRRTGEHIYDPGGPYVQNRQKCACKTTTFQGTSTHTSYRTLPSQALSSIYQIFISVLKSQKFLLQIQDCRGHSGIVTPRP